MFWALVSFSPYERSSWYLFNIFGFPCDWLSYRTRYLELSAENVWSCFCCHPRLFADVRWSSFKFLKVHAYPTGTLTLDANGAPSSSPPTASSFFFFFLLLLLLLWPPLVLWPGMLPKHFLHFRTPDPLVHWRDIWWYSTLLVNEPCHAIGDKQARLPLQLLPSMGSYWTPASLKVEHPAQTQRQPSL